MYCKNCPRNPENNAVPKEHQCKAMCESLKTFLAREENLHQGYLASEKLLNIIKMDYDSRQEKNSKSRSTTFKGVPISELSKTIRVLLSSFTPEERRIIVLRFSQNQPYEEIAKELKLHRRQRAHYKLNQLLKELRSYLKTIYQI